MAQQTDKEILTAFGLALHGDIVQNAIHQNRVASHQAEAKLREEVTDSELKMIDGSGYIQWGWEDGRRPGGMPPSSAILKWINDKGLPIPEKQKKSVAFLIARKIKEQGTLLFRQGGNSGVLTQAITQSRIDSLKGAFATKYMEEVTSEILKAFSLN